MSLQGNQYVIPNPYTDKFTFHEQKIYIPRDHKFFFTELGIMANEEESKRKLVECLWVEINRAIIGSQDVKSCINILKDLDLLDHVQGYNLVLDVKGLVELIQKDDKN